MKIELKSINKSFSNKTILSNINFHIDDGEIVGIIGESGKGKSTLLNIIGLLEKPNSGEVIIKDKNVYTDKYNIKHYFRQIVGYLFQNYALLENETINKNLDIALEYVNKTKKEKLELKKNIIKEVNLEVDLNSKTFILSGGEQQRLALARLLIKPCEIVLMDEPTSALDKTNKKIILELIKKFKCQNKSVIIATHDETVIEICDRIIEL